MAIKTIRVKDAHMVRLEFQAAGTIKPGHIIQENSGGNAVVHSTSGGDMEGIVAIEDALYGKNIDTNYTSGNRVQAVCCSPGDEVQLRVANGVSVSRNDWLESNGDGYVKVHTPDVDSSANAGTTYLNAVKFKALEAVDMSDSSAADPTGLIRARCV